MRRAVPSFLLPVLCLPLLPLIVAATSAAAAPATVPAPPPTRQEDFKEVLHGVEIPDPYRWLEDQQAPETRRWIDAQNAYSHALLDKLPARDSIRRRLDELLSVDAMSAPAEQNGRYVFSLRRAKADLASLYLRRGLTGQDELLLDPAGMSADHTVTVTDLDLSRDGRLLVYGIRHGGEDELEVRVLDLDSRKDLPDRLPRALYRGIVLKPDGSGFYYNLQDRETGIRTLFHALGTDPAADVQVFGGDLGKDKWAGIAEVTSDGRYALFVVNHGWGRTQAYLQDLTAPGGLKAPIKPIIDGLDAYFNVQLAGHTLFTWTDWQASNRRILAIDLDHPAREQWREIVPAGPDPLQGFAIAGGKLFVHYLHDVTSRIKIFSLDGKPEGEVFLPGLGSVGGLGSRWDGREVFFDFESFTVPSTTFRYDVATAKTEVWTRDRVRFSSEPFETRQVWYRSKDGTRIPMFLVHKKGLSRDRPHPTRLYGYGGFRVSLLPRFSAAVAWWLEQGGVYAMANLRGGSELGEDWHRAGMLEKKQNVFDDFIGAAEWLIASGVTDPQHLAIEGTSNGGLLVGAALTQRPDLYRAVLCRFPDLDMVGYYRFENNNPPALLEYGDASKPDQFKFLYAYSPYQKVKPGTAYPAVLLVTGDADTRVPPLQARKMTARLQAASTSVTSGRPVLLLYDTAAGHSGGKPMSRVIDDASLEVAFLAWQLGLEPDRKPEVPAVAAPTAPGAPSKPR